AAAKTLELLEETLNSEHARQPADTVAAMLLAAASQDVGELLPQLEARAGELASIAERKLADRGERESRDLRETIVRQRARVSGELARHTQEHEQLTFDFDADERRQLETNMKSWERRLVQFDEELEHEPQRLLDFYVVQAVRVEPAGLV